MASVFPDTTSAGGIVYRDEAGAPTHPENVANAYPPAADFSSTCLLTALPSDCSARIEPRQLNAIVSELLSFAECLDPDGAWNCNSLQNICTSFTQWAITNVLGLIIADAPPTVTKPGTLWWESDTGNLFIWYDDGSSQQWVQLNGTDEMFVDGISIVGSGTITTPYTVGLVDGGQY